MINSQIRVKKIIGTVKCVATCGAIRIQHVCQRNTVGLGYSTWVRRVISTKYNAFQWIWIPFRLQT